VNPGANDAVAFAAENGHLAVVEYLRGLLE
jgi:hypothetical protein